MMVIGGEVYQMEMVYIKKQVVIYKSYLGDKFYGKFKNGLKHGLGE